jgi:hypothetical protein
MSSLHEEDTYKRKEDNSGAAFRAFDSRRFDKILKGNDKVSRTKSSDINIIFSFKFFPKMKFLFSIFAILFFEFFADRKISKSSDCLPAPGRWPTARSPQLYCFRSLGR